MRWRRADEPTVAMGWRLAAVAGGVVVFVLGLVELGQDDVDGVLLMATVAIGTPAGLRWRSTQERHSRELAERNRASLAASEEHYRRLTECSSDIVVRHSADGVMAWVSPAVTEVLGWTPEELVGRHPQELLHPEDRKRVAAQHLPLFFNRPVVRFEARLRTSAGGYRWVQASMRMTGTPGDADGVSVWRDCQDAMEAREESARLTRELLDLEERLRMSVDVLPMGYARFRVQYDEHGGVHDLLLEHMNLTGRQGLESTVVRGASLGAFFPAARTNGIWDAIEQSLKVDEPLRLRWDLDGSGPRGSFDSHIVKLDEDTVVTVWEDITEQVQAERQLARAHTETAEAQTLLQQALVAVSQPLALWQYDPSGPEATTLLLANPALGELAGRPAPELVGVSLSALTSPDRARILHRVFEQVLVTGVAVDAPDWSSRSVPETVSRVWRPRAFPMDGDRLVMLLSDVTEHIRAAERMQRERDEEATSARVDQLTGLLNRRGFGERLAEALAADPPYSLAVVFADLDRFKEINDEHGHHVGDQLLSVVAERLGTVTREGDVVGRLGGDEFVILLRDLPDDWDQAMFVYRACAVVGAPVQLGTGRSFTPGCSFGVRRSTPTDTAQALIDGADSAMYEHKRARRTIQERRLRTLPEVALEPRAT